MPSSTHGAHSVDLKLISSQTVALGLPPSAETTGTEREIIYGTTMKVRRLQRQQVRNQRALQRQRPGPFTPHRKVVTVRLLRSLIPFVVPMGTLTGTWDC